MVGHSSITPIHRSPDKLRISQSVYGCKNVLSVCLGYFHYITGFESSGVVPSVHRRSGLHRCAFTVRHVYTCALSQLSHTVCKVLD